MAASPGTVTATPQLGPARTWDPAHQTFFLYGQDGTDEIPVTVDEINQWYYPTIAIAINYGSQVGASIMMLVVVLTMSPRLRAVKTATIINIASLAVNVVRMALLAAGEMSELNDFYAVATGDYSGVPDRVLRTNVFANTLGLLQLLLIEAALMLQAWTVVKLWRNPAKAAVFILSAAVALNAVAWRLAAVALRNKIILELGNPGSMVWVAEAMLISVCISICYFCALFAARLGIHMWRHRSFLPTTSNLTAMDVLVMTNGVLMIVPVIFASMMWADWQNFEAASMTFTAVVVVLPLGTLIAQRLASPQFSRYQYDEKQGGASNGSGSKKRFAGMLGPRKGSKSPRGTGAGGAAGTTTTTTGGGGTPRSYGAAGGGSRPTTPATGRPSGRHSREDDDVKDDLCMTLSNTTIDPPPAAAAAAAAAADSADLERGLEADTAAAAARNWQEPRTVV